MWTGEGGVVRVCVWIEDMDGVCVDKRRTPPHTTPVTATDAVSTHPTGMHPCFKEQGQWFLTW